MVVLIRGRMPVVHCKLLFGFHGFKIDLVAGKVCSRNIRIIRVGVIGCEIIVFVPVPECFCESHLAAVFRTGFSLCFLRAFFRFIFCLVLLCLVLRFGFFFRGWLFRITSRSKEYRAVSPDGIDTVCGNIP